MLGEYSHLRVGKNRFSGDCRIWPRSELTVQAWTREHFVSAQYLPFLQVASLEPRLSHRQDCQPRPPGPGLGMRQSRFPQPVHETVSSFGAGSNGAAEVAELHHDFRPTWRSSPGSDTRCHCWPSGPTSSGRFAWPISRQRTDQEGRGRERNRHFGWVDLNR